MPVIRGCFSNILCIHEQSMKDSRWYSNEVVHARYNHVHRAEKGCGLGGKMEAEKGKGKWLSTRSRDER